MGERPSRYKTRQRELIIACLEENKNRHITADNILSFIRERGGPVGRTTVYRHLERLAAEGVLIKYGAPDGVSACYQYRNPPENHAGHYHLVCTGCGQMSHLSCGSLDELSAHMKADHSFELDMLRTVLYGRCELCLGNGEREAEPLEE